jgi:hypothetical protein
MCIYWKAPLYTFTDHTLSAVISEQNTKKILVSQETLGYKSEALNIYIYSKDTNFKIFTHETKNDMFWK